MKKKNTVTCILILIFFAVTSLILTTLTITIDGKLSLDKKINRHDQRNLINNQVENRYHIEKNETISVYYGLLINDKYNYEFRYKFHPSTKNDNHRLMLILYGAKRICDDMWDFTVGIRTLNALHNFGYSILAICSKRKTYDVNIPISENKDAKYIYLSLQIWMNTIYYPQFKCYPLLYIHATSRGSKFAGILCRILPIQAQILNIYPGHQEAMLIPSIYNSDMQTQLIYNSTYSSWFYFDFCFNTASKEIKNQTLCPFQNNQNYFYPIPPTFFTYLKNDPYQNEKLYTDFIKEISKNSINLGGLLLTKTEVLSLDILPPLYPTISYMQENFHIWYSKPYASRWFYEFSMNQNKYSQYNLSRRTCWCSKIDYKYYERMPHITKTWSKQKQDEFSDYVRDIKKYINAFCEEVCGDLKTTHAMISRNINKALQWINKIDRIRRSMSRSILIYLNSKTTSKSRL